MAPTGDLDVVSAPAVRARLVELDGDGVDRVVVDLSAVDVVDSAGLGVLLGIVRRARRRGGEVRVVPGRDRHRDLLTLCRLDRAVDLHETVAAAVATPETPPPGNRLCGRTEPSTGGT